jgi:hypothetical protein
LLPRHQEAPEHRHIAGDRRGVDRGEISLRHLALGLLRQGGHVMPEDSDANVVKIIIDK